MTELEAVEILQRYSDRNLGVPPTPVWRAMHFQTDPQWAWVEWSCWELRVGLSYHMPELASIRVLRVYKLFYLFGPGGGANFDLQVGYSGRSERVKVIVEGIGVNTCRISLYRWVNGQRRRIAGGIVGVLHGNDTHRDMYRVENLETMPATGH